MQTTIKSITHKITSNFKLALGLFISTALMLTLVLAPINTAFAATDSTTGPNGEVPIVVVQNPQVTKIACAAYAKMIKNLMTQIKTIMGEKIKYYETQIQLLYTQAEAAFLAGDVDLYDSIMAQITSLENQLNAMISAFTATLNTLAIAYAEAIKNPCNLALVKELLKKALMQWKEAKLLCDRLMASLQMIK
jgi:Asp-tRNA(Asn)/Glu-tRNA(Gln) amidotransferase B subunit